MQVLVVPHELRGISLPDFLERSFPQADRVRLRALVARGGVRVNGQRHPSRRQLRGDDVVEVDTAGDELEARPLPAAAPLEVLFESPTAVVVHKPAGLVTVPDRFGKEDSVHARLPGLRPDADLRIVHRLDRDTSGCLLLAKGGDAARHFDALFQGAGVQKQYLALVHGSLAAPRVEIDLPLAPDPRRPGKVIAVRGNKKDVRAAHTIATAERRFRRFTLLGLVPTTGRTHQLRVHLNAIGHPIVGDRDYGGEPLLLSQLKPKWKHRRGVEERPLLQRMFLHAATLQFEDVDGTRVVVTAPLPDELQIALRKLVRFDARGR